MKAALYVWCLAAVAIAIVACATARSPSKAEAPAAMQPAAPAGGDAHAEIERLSAQVERDAEQLSLPEAPAAHTAGVEPRMPMSARTFPPPAKDDRQCHPAPSDACTDSCRLADSICTSAGKICSLADELAGDPWAEQKCTSSHATCDAAHAKCCGCQ